MRTQLSNFFWVAKSAVNPAESAYHVEVVDTAETMDEVAAQGGLTRTRTLNIAQATAEGFTLAAIGAAFSAEQAALAQTQGVLLAQAEARCDALAAQVHDLIGELAAQAEQAEAALLAATTAHEAALQAAANAHEMALRDQVAAHEATLADLAALRAPAA